MTPATTPARTPLLTERQLGEWLSVSAHSLAHRRCRGSGPPYIKVGGSVRYDEAAVRDWLRENTTQGTNLKPRRGKKDKTSSAEASAPLANPNTTGGGTGGPGANEKALTSASRQGLADPTHESILKPSSVALETLPR